MEEAPTTTERDTPVNFFNEKKVKYQSTSNDNHELDNELSRTPGRALHMHEKLLNMSRKP
jgi:hypothetical protein